jgi:hypothetical protein
MKHIVLMTVIGFGATMMLSGCGQKTPKEEVYNMTYEALVGDGGLSEERAKCVADKTVGKLSEENLTTLVKIHDLKEAGKEGEIQSSRKYMATTYFYVQATQGAISECDQ